ncbi:WD40-repeat-containing domain protein [Lactarius indigo]|nr:WD40-repeat-containing domain protein [Lactarius indigo]
MTSRASVTVGRPQRGLTIASSNTLKLTGIVINSDPRGSYRPSRMMDLIVDGEPRTASFQLREPSMLQWEVKPAVVITAKSVISIQPYEARTLIRRRKVETVTIQGDAVFRFCSTRPVGGDKHEYERICAGFKVVLSIVVQRDTKARDKTRGGPGGRDVAPGNSGRDVLFGPQTAPNSFKRSLDALLELMELIPSDWAIEWTQRLILHHTLQFMPTYNVEEDIQNLGEQACEVLVHMHQLKPPERFASQTQTLTSLLNLVWNAAFFAEDCSKPGFKEELGDPEARKNILQGFDRQFVRLKRNFLAGKDTYEWNVPYTRKQVASTPAIPSVDETRSELSTVEQEADTHTVALDEDQMLTEALNPDYTPTNLNLCCLDWTRRTLLSNIISWFESVTESNVLWLSGAPGTGKTTIAWSLISELEKQQRCAGEFFFRQNQHTPYQLWTTLAYKMAKFHPAIKGEIYKALTRENDVPDLNDIQVTFEKLIAGPLKALDARLSSRGPILLIDGLEQCGQGYAVYKTLLDTLPQWLSLPRHCKLIVTSRPQGDITKLFDGKDIKRLELLTGDDVDYETNNDMRTYLTHRFFEMRKQDRAIPENWPEYDALARLAEHASGSFKWAATAVDGIRDAGGDRERHLTTILEGGTTTKFDSLDQYFEEALSMEFDGNSPDAFRATMGTIALSKEPLTLADLEQFLQDRFPSSSGVSLEDMCYKLLSIISIEGERKAVKLRHKAYKDYLIDSKRCTGSFHVDQARAHRNTTISCLKIMQQGLKFNICGLKSSYRRNYEIEDQQSLIEKCIPSHLAYACRFWADHLRGVSSTEKRDTEIVNLLRNFLNFHLLYWLEVLSLLSVSNIASKSLLSAAEWLEGTDKDLSLLAADGSRFALTFADVIAESAPHIYLSALPFSPPSSLVHKRYHDQFPRTVKVIREDGVKWPAMRFSIPMSNIVYGISIHPDGKKVAAAMGSIDVAVVSVTTGETLCQLGGHGATVRTVAYSSSGKRIATGCDDRRLRIFESENGALLFGPFELHSDWIRSVAWSPDGQRIVTSSDDRKVKVVVAETGHVIYDTAFHNDWVRTVVYTTDFFISGSDDRTVRIYDANTGAASGEAWTTGQSGYIRAIAISPDNKILAAGSDDNTIMLYDMDTRSTINQPLKGHTSAIRSLAFSKDGQLLASGSDDYTVRLWNVQTGKKICDPLYGHTSYVSSVRFSPDMKQLISGAEDYTIRSFDMDSLPIWGKFLGGTGPFRAAVSLPDGSSVLACDGFGIWKWNLNDGHVENVPFEGHSEHLSNMQSAAISPYGTLVATAGRDRGVMIWQADSGKVLYGPLEGHSDDIYALSFSADGKMVASGSDDRKIWVWSAETGQRVCGPMEGHAASVKGSTDNAAIIWSVESGEKVLGPLEYHRDWIYGIAYSPNGLYLATASDDYTVVIWDVASGERVFQGLTGHGGYLRCVNWSSDSKKVVTAALDNLIRVFDVETGTLVCEPLSGHKSTLTSVAFRSFSSSDEPEVVSDSDIFKLSQRLGQFSPHVSSDELSIVQIHSISISPANDCIASGSDDGQVVVMDVVTGDYKLGFQPHTDWIRCVTYSPDGSKIATCSDDCTISIWNAVDGERFLGPFDDHTKAVLSIAFSPGGNFLISGSEDSTIRSWDLHPLFSKLNNPLITYRGHKSAVNAVAYARGGSLIVSGSSDAEIAVWEGSVSDRRILQIGGHGGPILSICAFDEKIFSSSEDRSIRVWELSTGHALISILHAHAGPINSIALSPDGRRIVSASDDASIRIFDSDSGEPCTLPLRISNRIFSVTVSHDGALVACGDADRTVHVWRANMARRAAWPDSFMRKARGTEFCLVDEQGILADFSLSDDGWLRGSTNEIMCWIPSIYRAGLWTPRTVGILGALETMLDMKNYVHGTKWEQCRAYSFADKA